VSDQTNGAHVASTPAPERRTFVSIEVQMGFDEEWHQVGLDEPPTDAGTLVAQLKEESHGSIRDLIRDWSLDDFVTVRVEVRHNQNGKVARTNAEWSQP
jgi:hypothetical protein